MSKRGYTVAEASAILGLSRPTIYKLISIGALRTYGLGKKMIPIASPCMLYAVA